MSNQLREEAVRGKKGEGGKRGGEETKVLGRKRNLLLYRMRIAA